MWKQITQINWAKRCTKPDSFDGAKQFIMHTYSEKQGHELTEFVQAKHAELSNRIADFGKAGQYNNLDTFNDMVAHVIGLGEQKFNDTMEFPSKHLDGLEYVESFMYCLPHPEDYDIRAETKACVSELDRIIIETGVNTTITNLMKRFNLMLSGEFKKATKGFNGRVYDDMRFFDGNDCSAKFANLIRDCNKFYVA